jgi:hypothetical protein
MKKILVLALTTVFALNQVTYASSGRSALNSKLMQNLVSAQIKAQIGAKSGDDQKLFLERSATELDKAAEQINSLSDSAFEKAKKEALAKIANEDVHKTAMEIRAKMSSSQVELAQASINEELLNGTDGDPVVAALEVEARKYQGSVMSNLKKLNKPELLKSLKATKEEAKASAEEIRLTTVNISQKLILVFMVLAIIALVLVFLGFIGWGLGAATSDLAFASAGMWMAIISAIGTVLFFGLWLGTSFASKKLASQIPETFAATPVTTETGDNS